MKISGDICIDFRDNSLEEIKSIKNFFKDNKEDYLWIKEGNLKDDIFLFSHYLSFTSVSVYEGALESVKSFLNEMVIKHPSIGFKGLVLEEKDNLLKELKIRKYKNDKNIKFNEFEKQNLNLCDLDCTVLNLSKEGYTLYQIANQLEINVHFVEEIIKN